MKNKLQSIFLLLLAVLLFNNVDAQKRSSKNVFTDGTVLQSVLKYQPTFYQSALSGYYFEGFETAFPPIGWQVVDIADTVYTWNESNTADFPAAYEGTKSAYCRWNFNATFIGEDWFIAPQFSVNTGDSLSFRFKLEYRG